MSRLLKVTLAYDGTEFYGWQVQSRGRTVQAVVEAALARMQGEPVRVEHEAPLRALPRDRQLDDPGAAAHRSPSTCHQIGTVTRLSGTPTVINAEASAGASL